MAAFLILILLALGLLLVSFLSSVLRDIGEIKRSLRQLDEDVREIKNATRSSNLRLGEHKERHA